MLHNKKKYVEVRNNSAMNDKKLRKLIMATIKCIPSNIGLPSPLKVAAYYRVSMNRHNQLNSLASQEHYYEAMIKNHKYAESHVKKWDAVYSVLPIRVRNVRKGEEGS